MRISKIEKINGIFHVTFIPNKIEKFFGVKEQIKKYKATCSTYMLGGGTVYVAENGEKLSNGHWVAESIDRWRNSF